MPIEVITCGDLAARGHPWGRLWQHDPRAMVAGDDVLCHCHDGWGRNAPPETYDPVECEILAPIPVADRLNILVCCLCLREFTEVLRTCGRESDLHRWLRWQVGEAMVHRDDQRRHSSPVPCAMDVQAAGVDRTEEER